MKSIVRDNQSLFVRFGFFQKSRKNPKLSHHVNCSNLSLWHFNPTRCIFKLFSGPWDDINLLSLQVNCVIILWTQNCNEFYDVNLAKTSVTRFARLALAIRLHDNSPAVIQAVTAAMTTPQLLSPTKFNCDMKLFICELRPISVQVIDIFSLCSSRKWSTQFCYLF